MDPNISDLSARLGALTRRDQDRLERQLQRARSQRDGEARRKLLDALGPALEAAERRVATRRAAALPHPSYPAGLPVSQRRDDIAAAIRDHQVVIVAGETGSGKSTQIPKICLELGRGVLGLIGHTQPRRLAARAVAERVAEELGGEVGGTVGYAVRFTDRVGERTMVKVMTDGILLAEIQRDRQLLAYDTIIVDEAHERSLNIDFILGYLKSLLPRRPDLKVIVTSATIDTERFSQHFGDAPVVEVSGRTYSVELRYRPIEEDEDRDQVQAVLDAVDELRGEGRGDILVFLSGEREIRDTADALGALARPDTEILPLYARLSAAEQHRVFAHHPGRRIVLATNVAETSLTVPGILFVVDPGTARISRFNRRTKVQRLPIEPVSQASANQRAGRCGRVAPGICIRLYSEDDFAARPEFTEPEILRTNLASVILQMAAIGLGDIAAFPFVDPPDPRAIKDGIALLEELGALDPAERDSNKRLTPLGRKLARFPLDPRLGRMVLEGERNGCLHEVMVIAAALSIQDPRERPLEQQQAAAECHARFVVPDSDFLAFVRLWDYLTTEQTARTSSQFRKLCRQEFLNYLRVREWQDIYGQLAQVVRELGFRPNTGPADRNSVHRALLAGLLSHIGLRPGPRQDYQGARGVRFAITPGSALARAQPHWVMAAELVETNRLWARGVARIEPEWAERLGSHLVKRSYSEPQWDAERGGATALERVTLYGLPIVTARKVDYGRVDPVAARDLFIRHALVEGDWRTHHAFVAHNQAIWEEVRALGDRARRHDFMVDEEVLVDFFAERIPAEVTSARHFDRWWKGERAADPDRLSFTPALLIRPGAAPVDPGAYPDSWLQDGLELPLTYEYEPGSETDGVTVSVPLPVLHRLDPAPFQWQVPGLREELVTALIRSLPKPVRRNFVPAADYARAVVAGAGPGAGPLLDVAARHLSRLTGDPIPPGAWDLDRVPDHLRMTFRVADEAGRPIDSDKDLAALRRRLRDRLRAAIADGARAYQHTGLEAWPEGGLPRRVDIRWAGHTLSAYPALVDEGDTVGVRVFPTQVERDAAMWAGTRRLLLLTGGSPTRAALRLLTNDTKLVISRSPYASAAELLADCAEAALDELMAAAGAPAWDAHEFDALARSVRARLVDSIVYIVTMVGGILAVAHSLEGRLDRTTAPSLQPAAADLRAQLAGLVRRGFVGDVGPGRLADILRYLQAMERRLDKLTEGPGRDLDSMRRVQRLEDTLHDLVDTLPRSRAPELERVRWMIEELRVSLFAQSLGTPQPVSEARIARDLDRLCR